MNLRKPEIKIQSHFDLNLGFRLDLRVFKLIIEFFERKRDKDSVVCGPKKYYTIILLLTIDCTFAVYANARLRDSDIDLTYVV